jgi:hypothetical protein
MNFTRIRISCVTIFIIIKCNFETTFNYTIMKKNKLKPVKKDSMLYQKTNEDFNNEKPSKIDPTQIKVHPIEEENKIKFL